jgi:EmrB/QacA subfamily drug resistance transporter
MRYSHSTRPVLNPVAGTIFPNQAPPPVSPRHQRHDPEPSPPAEAQLHRESGDGRPIWENRWLGLVVLSLALAIIVLDNAIINVAIPTIAAEFSASLGSLQWVISGYSLVVATLLITFGRVGDLIGRRRLFIAGAFLFGAGSFLASISYSTLDLFIGAALVEGIGAAMMLPATLSLISSMFSGRERGIAFAVWGAIAGAAGTFGPLVGGWLTTYYSWRWSFRINVIIAPIAILGALLLIRESRDPERAQRFDVPGMIAVSLGLFWLVFACIEGERFGWLETKEQLSILGWTWTYHWSFIPLAGLIGIGFLAIFAAYEWWLERRKSSPLFQLSLLRHRGFRYGLLTTMVLAMGEFGLVFVLPIFLQSAQGLSAVDTGIALLPLGLSVIAAAPFAGRLSQRFGPKWLITTGMALEAGGIGLIAIMLTPAATSATLVPGLILYGVGLGLATAQLTNVILSDIPAEKAGVASGVNGMVRQVGTALGIAIIGSILSAQLTAEVTRRIDAETSIPAAIKQQIESQVDQRSIATNQPTEPSPLTDTITRIRNESITEGTKRAAGVAAGFVVFGSVFSLLIPNIAKSKNESGAGHS